MYCTNCGAEILEDECFCRNCGTPVSLEDAAPPAPEVVRQQPKKRKKGGLLALLTLLLLLALAAFFVIRSGIPEDWELFQTGQSDTGDEEEEEEAEDGEEEDRREENHQHDWADADCENPKTCADCGEEKGEPLGHDWVEGDCETPGFCTRCGAEDGPAPGHSWMDATCTDPKICANCGLVEGETLPHAWQDATLAAPQTCAVCGETTGEPLQRITMDHIDYLYASSVFRQEDRIYWADNAVDGKLSTAWVENAAGQGEGEYLLVVFDGEYVVSKLNIYAGYHKSDEHYVLNSRPKEIELKFSDGTTQNFTLPDVKTCHTLTLDREILTDSVYITILSVYPGEKDKDTCISELTLE